MVPLWDRGHPRPQESAQNVPSKRGTPAPRSTALRQSPNAVAGHALSEAAPMNHPDQSTLFQLPKGTADSAPVHPCSPGEVVVRGPRRAVPGVAVEHQPDRDFGPAQLRQGEVNKGVEHGEALARLPLRLAPFPALVPLPAVSGRRRLRPFHRWRFLTDRDDARRHSSSPPSSSAAGEVLAQRAARADLTFAASGRGPWSPPAGVKRWCRRWKVRPMSFASPCRLFRCRRVTASPWSSSSGVRIKASSQPNSSSLDSRNDARLSPSPA